jgi:hypothetical protein
VRPAIGSSGPGESNPESLQADRLKTVRHRTTALTVVGRYRSKRMAANLCLRSS